MDILRERVRSVGISLLGGKSGMEGPYELGIESIRALNSDDIIPSSSSEFLIIVKSLAVFDYDCSHRKGSFTRHAMAAGTVIVPCNNITLDWEQPNSNGQRRYAGRAVLVSLESAHCHWSNTDGTHSFTLSVPFQLCMHS